MKHTNNLRIFSSLLLSSVLLLSAGQVLASSHRDAPLISEDPAADATDFYAFVSPDKPDTVTLIANYIAAEEAAIDSNYRFSDNVLYAINIDNDGDAREDISYQFRFKTEYRDKTSLLYASGPIESLDDSDFHMRQTYTLTKVERGVSTTLGQNLPVPPVNIGPKSIPNYELVSNAAITKVADGITVFAGQVDDPFFVDIGSLIDGITIRKLPGNDGGGVDGIAGFNTHALALQIPIQNLVKNKIAITDAKDPNAVIGMWTASYRQATQVLKSNTDLATSGKWIQVSRVGAPLTNDFFIPVVDKDIWNGTEPKDDTRFYNYIANPGVVTNIHNIYGIKVPPQGPYGSPLARNDLVTVLLTGIPGLNQPAKVVPSEQLRLNVAIPPTQNPNPMGVVGGDNQGYPNGRRLMDDTIDISLRAAAGVIYPLLVDKNYQPDPLAGALGDGVDTNDRPFRSTFPYLALPLSGYDSIPHASGFMQQFPKLDPSMRLLPLALLFILVVLILSFLGLGHHKKKAVK